MVVEDLHWLDPSSLELQQLLAEQGAIAPLMLLYTARPEFRQPWPHRSHHTQITLNRLSTRDAQKMIAQVAARHALPRETLDAVMERTSGVPLFVEELTRAVLESSDARPGGTLDTRNLARPIDGAAGSAGSGKGGGSASRRNRHRIFLRTASTDLGNSRRRIADSAY